MISNIDTYKVTLIATVFDIKINVLVLYIIEIRYEEKSPYRRS